MSSRPTLEKVYVCEKETNNYVQVKSFGCVVEHLRRGKKAEWKGKKGEEEKVTPEMTEEEKEGLRGEEGEERKLGWEERETVEVDLGENGEGGFFLSLANSASPSSSSSPSPSFKTEKSIPLCHSPICPMRGCDERAIVPLASTQKKIKVGVCVLIEDCDHNILITQRAPLRIFPGMWVLPGGHWDPGETSLTTALREVKEETGITIPPSSLTPLCLWESSFPISLSVGPPKAHHLVIFYRALLPSSSSSLSLSLQVEEVQGCCWVGREEVGRIVKGEEVKMEGTRVRGEGREGEGEWEKGEVVVGGWEVALGHIFALRVWEKEGGGGSYL